MITADTIQVETIKISKHSDRRFYHAVKRSFDVTFAAITVILLIPLTLIIKLAFICTGDFHSVFFRHQRVGKNGREFMLYKFRTMVPNADAELERLLTTDETFRQKWQKSHKLEDDPRITKVGKFLRKTSIDELPQVINILKGDMSLIGPRPITHPEVKAYRSNQSKLLSIRPGLTGWWACNGRSCTSAKARRDLELFYCDNLSFSLDLKCFGRTIIKVITQEGAR